MSNEKQDSKKECCKKSAEGELFQIIERRENTQPDWIEGFIVNGNRKIPVVSKTLKFSDRLDSWKARWSSFRMRFSIDPGLYAVGNPDAQSEVLVSANYKLSFDRLRSRLDGVNAWILVLDTKGINVWCSAGKGTFGTAELVNRIKYEKLTELISHRRLILPQLSAPGVSAHKVKKDTGFRIIYGPVRANDIAAFLKNNKRANPEMRRVRFNMSDRAVLIPMEMMQSVKYLLLVSLVFLLLSGLNSEGYIFNDIPDEGLNAVILMFIAYLSGGVLTPLLLPFIPGKAFSLKGLIVGIVLMGGIAIFSHKYPGLFRSNIDLLSWFFITPSISSFLAMNFTGASTYTSLSGVKKEMRFAVPAQIVLAVVGITLWVISQFI
ncbi:MAG: acetyl-CoA synthase subunit gamma [candidate division Zixibacteria bacterium]|nr:acetyl-CoA synthase subunit gamma [candidate division Zixibacteria bacterium]